MNAAAGEGAQTTPVLTPLTPHVRASPDVYRHRWQVGDLVFRGNRRVLHARTDFPADQRRTLRRIPAEVTAPVAAPDGEPAGLREETRA